MWNDASHPRWSEVFPVGEGSRGGWEGVFSKSPAGVGGAPEREASLGAERLKMPSSVTKLHIIHAVVLYCFHGKVQKE